MAEHPKSPREQFIDYINSLLNESFEGWTEDQKKGYYTAIISLHRKFNELFPED